MEKARVSLWRPTYFLRFCWVLGPGQVRRKLQGVDTRCPSLGSSCPYRKYPPSSREEGEDTQKAGRVEERTPKYRRKLKTYYVPDSVLGDVLNTCSLIPQNPVRWVFSCVSFVAFFSIFSKDKISIQPRLALNSWDIRVLATTPVCCFQFSDEDEILSSTAV